MAVTLTAPFPLTFLTPYTHSFHVFFSILMNAYSSNFADENVKLGQIVNGLELAHSFAWLALFLRCCKIGFDTAPRIHFLITALFSMIA